MKHIRAFLAGIFLPCILLPIALGTWIYLDHRELLQVYFVHLIPVLWGVWNILFFAYFRNLLPGNENTRLLIAGGALGLMVASVGVFWENIPEHVGFVGHMRFLPLIVGPIIYALAWRYIVKPLNSLLGLTN